MYGRAKHKRNAIFNSSFVCFFVLQMRFLEVALFCFLFVACQIMQYFGPKTAFIRSTANRIFTAGFAKQSTCASRRGRSCSLDTIFVPGSCLLTIISCLSVVGKDTQVLDSLLKTLVRVGHDVRGDGLGLDVPIVIIVDVCCKLYDSTGIGVVIILSCTCRYDCLCFSGHQHNNHVLHARTEWVM